MISFIVGIWGKEVKLIEAEDEREIAQARDEGTWGEVGQRIRISNQKKNNFWELPYSMGREGCAV